MLKVINIANNTQSDLQQLFKKYGDLEIKMHKQYAVIKYRDARSAFVAQQKLNRYILNNSPLQLLRYNKQLEEIQDEEQRQLEYQLNLQRQRENLKLKEKQLNQNEKSREIMRAQLQQLSSMINSTEVPQQIAIENYFVNKENSQVFKKIYEDCNEKISNTFLGLQMILEREKQKTIKEFKKFVKNHILNLLDDNFKNYQLENFRQFFFRQTNKTEVDIDVIISRLSKQIRIYVKKQNNNINLEYQSTRSNPNKVKFQNVKEFQQFLQFENPSNNPVKRLLSISNRQFVASVQSKQVKFYSQESYLPKDQLLFEKTPYAMCLHEDQILVGDKSSKIWVLKNTNPPIRDIINFDFSKNEPIIEIKQYDKNIFIGATRDGFISKFKVDQEQILEDQKSLIFNEMQKYYGEGIIFSMDILDKNQIVLGQQHKLHFLDIQKHTSQIRVFKKRINKVLSWGSQFLSYSHQNFINILDKRNKKDVSNIEIHGAHQIISMQRLSDYKIAHGSNCLLTISDLRNMRGPYWSNRKVHTDYIKDIVCLQNYLISGGLDSKIVSWKII